MYYYSGLNKTEIAHRLGISRFRVSRLLDQAQREGIVRIQVVEPVATFVETEEALEQRFNLLQAIVVRPTGPTYQATLEAIGRAAASRLGDLLSNGDVLGMTWGETANEVVKALPPKLDVKLDVVQITGGLNQMAIDVNAIDLVRRVAEICDARSYVLHAPAMVSSPAARAALMSDTGIRETCDMFERVTIALSGIGALTSNEFSNYIKAGYVDDRSLQRLRQRKAVGDVFAHFFDSQGNICDAELEERIFGMSVAQLRNTRYSIGVAGGMHKSLAVLGALRGRLINVLITDHVTAQEILKEDKISQDGPQRTIDTQGASEHVPVGH
jgi:DNA-binding transcriptional regulator LsrR (DeoR family)